MVLAGPWPRAKASASAKPYCCSVLRQSPSAAAAPTRARCEARVTSKDMRQNSDMRTDDQLKKSISRSLLMSIALKPQCFVAILVSPSRILNYVISTLYFLCILYRIFGKKYTNLSETVTPKDTCIRPQRLNLAVSQLHATLW